MQGVRLAERALTSPNAPSPLEPPGLKLILVFLYHVIALKAAAVTQALQNLH